MGEAVELNALYDAAKAATPGIEVPRDTFTAWLRARPGFEPAHLAELYLACACARGDPLALNTFESRYFPPLTVSLERFGSGMADELKQQLRERLFVGAKLSEYSGRGSLGRWLRAVSVRLAINHHHATATDRQTTALDEDDVLGAPLAEDPELAHMKGLYRTEFKQASTQALASLEPELQNYLRLYYLDGLGLAELSAMYKVSVPTASRRLAKARDEVLAATRQLLRARLSVSPEDLESIMRLIQSRLTLGPVPKGD